MTPTIIEGATHVLRAPDSWPVDQEGDCGDLHVRLEDHKYTSEWELSPGDLLRLQLGGRVRLTVYGMQPAVKLEVVGS